MSSRELGKAEYVAVRNGDFVKLIASGVKRGIYVKPDIEQLPFLIYPPMYGFYFVVPDVDLPSNRSFVHEEEFPFPRTSQTVTILDADGKHGVPIDELTIQVPVGNNPNPADDGYCVFSWIGTDMLKIAECTAILPAVYTKVFGPTTYRECSKYAEDNEER